ncbi:SdpI family protein [Flavobacterium suaedae]|uniref:SdpI family protein n=1 Tax=Flavobacterium suaedae TaxID=1767027 RepID=UPI00166DBF3F|nr:SdpI family protein [Flavobacterium suaedae]
MENIFTIITSNISLLVGIIFLITALILFKFPPKDINHLYGYRTSRSMKSQESWYFAQRYSAIRMVWLSIVLILFGIIDLFYLEGYEITMYVGLALMILGFIYIIITTERELKKRF